MQNYGASIQLADRMTPVLTNIMNAVNMTVSSVYQLQSSVSSDFDTSSFNAINESMAQAQVLVDEINRDINRTGSEIDENTNNQKRFNTEINTGSANALQLGNVIGRVGSMLGAYVSFSAFKSVASDAVEFASDLTEVQNVVDVTFGASANVVDEWSTTTLNAFGLNELSAKQYAGTMGAMLKSSGLASEAAREMSMTVTGLAGDMASFYNLSGDDAFQKIRSGLSGETEPLKALGVNMSVANLEAYALSQGVKTAYNEMSQAEQVMLRYNYLLSVTADAQGDFARTSDSYANQTKLLSENWKSFTGEIATDVLPYLSQVVQQTNQLIAKMQPYSGQLADAFGTAIAMAGKLLNAVASVGGFFVRNWSVISPIVYGVAAAIGAVSAAMLIYNTYTTIKNGLDAISAARSALKTGATLAEAAATTTATGAQAGLNAAMLASPVTWIILGIIALIAVIFIVINAIQKVTGTTTSACGMIFGVICWLGALILNTVIGLINGIIQFVWMLFVEPFLGIIEWVLNATQGGFDSFGGAVANLIGNVISWFLSLGKVVTTIIDAIFGTDWTGGLSALQNDVLSWGKTDNAVTISRDAPQINYRMDMTDAYNWGTEKGDVFWGSIKDTFSFDIPTETENSAVTSAAYDTAANTSAIADTTQDISDTVSAASDEELAWLRKIAERETVNRFTTAEIKLDFNSTATLNSDMDIDGYVNTFTKELEEVLVSTAEDLEK